MIRANDRVELAPGVRLHGPELVDDVRGVRIGLNATALVALRHSTPDAMAGALCARFRVDRARADADALTLCARLNAALLANVRVATLRLVIRWFGTALMLAPLRQVPSWPARRRDVCTASVFGSVATVTRGTGGPAGGVSAATALPLAAVGLPRVAIAVGLAAGIGLVLHELAHAVALRGVAAAVIVRGVRVSLLHRKLDRRREFLVAAAGPLTVVGASLATLAVVHATSAAFAAPVPAILGLHALGLTVLGADGRKLCAGC